MANLQFIKNLFRTKLQNILHTETINLNIIEHFRVFCSYSTKLDSSYLSLPQVDIDPIGEYSVSGNNPWDPEANYFGSLSITNDGSQYRAVWRIGFSGDGHSGVGIYASGYLSLVFSYMDAGNKYYGKVIYAVMQDRLLGLWAEPGTQVTGTEVCLRKS